MPLRLNARLFIAAPLGVVIAITCHAQNPTDGYPVHGSVVNRVTHQPIARALVEEGSIAVLTDEEGRFELQLPQGMQQLTVRRPGFRQANQQHAVFVGANMPELNFELNPQISVSGEVTLSSGEQADAIHIKAFRKSIVDGNREEWLAVQDVFANASGSFRIPAVERAGSYVFCSGATLDDASSPPANGQASPIERFGYRPTCYPGPLPQITGLFSQRNAANTVTLVAGQHVEIDLPLTREPFYHVIIPFLNAARWPVLAVQIHSVTDQGFDYPLDWKFKLGYAEAYLPNGQYFAEAITTSETDSAYGRVDFRVADKPLVVSGGTMLPLHAIPVEIRKDFSESASRSQGQQSDGPAFSKIRSNDPGVGLAPVSAEGKSNERFGGGGLIRVPGSNDTSQYELAKVVPGRYWIESYPSQGYVSSISSGGVDLTRQPLTVGAGNSTAPIDINLRNDAGHIQITASASSDSEPAPYAPPQAADSAASTTANTTVGEIHAFYVYAIPLTRILWQTPQTQGQGSDSVTIDGLAPGQYCVVAFDRQQEFNLNDPETIGRLTSLGQTVTVAAGGTANAQLTVHHTEEDEPDFVGIFD